MMTETHEASNQIINYTNRVIVSTTVLNLLHLLYRLLCIQSYIILCVSNYDSKLCPYSWSSNTHNTHIV